MKSVNRAKFAAVVAGLVALTAPMFAKNPPDTIENKVRHELVMLPYLNLFDDISFRVDNGVVTLFGDVTQPVLKSDAGNVVKRVEGVTRVDNQINVLPLSPLDDRIRMQAYRTIFSGPLYRYAMGALPSIHIIVNNGHITLKGEVVSKADSELAYMRANQLGGVFSVDNELQVIK